MDAGQIASGVTFARSELGRIADGGALLDPAIAATSVGNSGTIVSRMVTNSDE
jgi:hypothetical protein